ncbi:MAG TPA: RNA methyltransferase, partial [Accumulibacter sp.]|nr:RNA methyltransferase [Accumulibacter sp.]
MNFPATSRSSATDPAVAPAAEIPVTALSRIRIVLAQPSHPGNIGAAARAMKTMGLSRLYLVNPKRFPDDEAVARAAGADDLLERAVCCDSVDQALADVRFACAVSARHRHLGPPTLPARHAATELYERTADGDVALLFGNESAGLANADVQRCQRMLYIPADPTYSSLNLAAAVQVLCYELRLAAFAGSPLSPSRVVPFSSPPASYQDIERFYAHLQRVMIGSGFLDPQRPRRLMPKLRRLFARAELECDEIDILRGLLDAIE